MTPRTAPTDDWRERALCAGTAIHYGVKDTVQDSVLYRWERLAITVCHRCPVEERCLADALTHPQQHGVAGGKTAGQRRALLARDTPDTAPTTKEYVA